MTRVTQGHSYLTSETVFLSDLLSDWSTDQGPRTIYLLSCYAGPELVAPGAVGDLHQLRRLRARYPEKQTNYFPYSECRPHWVLSIIDQSLCIVWDFINWSWPAAGEPPSSELYTLRRLQLGQTSDHNPISRKLVLVTLEPGDVEFEYQVKEICADWWSCCCFIEIIDENILRSKHRALNHILHNISSPSIACVPV